MVVFVHCYDSFGGCIHIYIYIYYIYTDVLLVLRINGLYISPRNKGRLTQAVLDPEKKV